MKCHVLHVPVAQFPSLQDFPGQQRAACLLPVRIYWFAGATQWPCCPQGPGAQNRDWPLHSTPSTPGALRDLAVSASCGLSLCHPFLPCYCSHHSHRTRTHTHTPIPIPTAPLIHYTPSNGALTTSGSQQTTMPLPGQPPAFSPPGQLSRSRPPRGLPSVPSLALP